MDTSEKVFSIIDFIKLLGEVKKQCGADHLYLKVIDEPFLEFEIIVDWIRNGEKITFQKHFSIFVMSQQKESPGTELSWFAREAREVIQKHTIDLISNP